MFEWIKTEERLPKEYTDVLVYTDRGEMAVGRWLDKSGLSKGRFWVIAGRSGGIGTSMEVKPPLYWGELPKSPNNHNGG